MKKYANKSSDQKGKINLSLLILILFPIIAAVFLAGGIFPTVEHIPTGPPKIGIPDPNASDMARNNLQLRTIPFKECTERVAVDLLVDNSGSISYGTKLPNLKEALTAFAEKLTDDSIIALHSFNDRPPQEKVPFSYYKDVRQQFSNAVNSMTVGGGTHTRDAFNFVNNKLTAAQQQFPNQEFALIFFSDGIPEALPRDCQPKSCASPQAPNRCFQQSQDPTRNPDIAITIKNKGIQIYSIALLDVRDQCYNDELTALMQEVASSPQHYFQTFNPEDLTSIYQQITFSICGEQT